MFLNGLSKIYTNADTKNSGHRVIRTSSPPHTPPLNPYTQVMFPYCTNRTRLTQVLGKGRNYMLYTPCKRIFYFNKRNNNNCAQCPLNLNGGQRCVAIVNWRALTQTPIELSDEDESDLASRLIAAVNVPSEEFNGHGLFIRPKDSVSTCTVED
jgi:hypothetical protein